MKVYNNPLFLRLAISFYGGGYKCSTKVFEKINSILNSCDIQCQIKIGDNSVVLHDVEANTVVAGVPAKVIKINSR